MKKAVVSMVVLLLVATLGFPANLFAGPPTITGLGDLPGGIFFSQPNDISGDGSIVVGYSNSPLGPEAFRWTAEGGMIGLGDILVDLGGSESFATGTSADGSVVVGRARSSLGGGEAFRWTAAGGMVGLGDLLSGSSRSIARGVSADGLVVVGQGSAFRGGNKAFRWTHIDGMVGLDGGNSSSATGASADGEVVVGGFGGNKEAFRWTPASGMVGLGDLPGGDFPFSEAFGVSDDGSVVVGHGTGLEAFVWDSTNVVMRPIRDMLVDAGLDMTGWTLNAASNISANGLSIVGSGIHNGFTEGWIVTRDRADLNIDFIVDSTDLGLLLSSWGSSGSTDLNGDSMTDGADLGLLLGAWLP